MDTTPPAIKDPNFPIDLDPVETHAGFKHVVIEMPLTQGDLTGTTPQTIIAAKEIESGVLLVKMTNLLEGGVGYGLFVFGRDSALLDIDFIKPEWNQSWDGIASSLDTAQMRLGKPNMDVNVPAHRDSPPSERVPTRQELG
jgi:hypothetical protein